MTRDVPGQCARVTLVTVMSLVLVLSIAVPAAALYDPQEDGDVDPVQNNEFPQECGVDVTLLLDNTASLSGENLSDVKEAANSTVDSLATTDDVSSVGIVSFNANGSTDNADTRIANTQLDSSSNVTSVKEAIGGISLPPSETLTNWEAPFLEASESENDEDDVAHPDANKPADLVIIVSDGRPNAYGYPGLNGSFDGNAVEAATLGANVVKNEGSRVIGIGYPDENGNSPPANPFEQVTNGSASISDSESSEPQKIDYYLVGDSSQVESKLLAIANEIDCGVSVEKTNDAGGDNTFTDNENGQEVTSPGADVPFQVDVTNTGNIDLNISDFSDSKYGSDFLVDCAGTDINTNEQEVAAGETVTCEFTQSAPNDDNVVHNNTFTVTASDDNGYSLSDDDWTEFQTEDIQPDITVVKSNDANMDGSYSDTETAPAGGAEVTFKVEITNNVDEQLDVDSISDDLHGSGTAPTNENVYCGDVSTLGPSETVTCYFNGTISDDDALSETNTVTVDVSDDDGNSDTGSDTSTVQTEDIQPDITVVKSNDANMDGSYSDTETAPAGGAEVTFKVEITNNVDEQLDVDSISDDLHDTSTVPANEELACSEVSTLAPGETVTCYFNGTISDDDALSETDTVTVDVSDDDGNSDTGSDTSTVQTEDIQPAIAVEKLVDADGDGTFADSETAANPGDSVTYQVTVRNTGDDTVSLDSYDDSIYGVPTLNNSWPTELAPGESAVRTFTGSAPSDDTSSKTNTFRVNASDDDGNGVSDSDDATVNSPDIEPTIAVVKTVDADSDGDFADTETATSPGDAVTYAVNVTNTGDDAVSIDSYDDSVYDVSSGDLNKSLAGTSLGPGESIVVEFDGTAPTDDASSKTNTFRVNASDDDGNDVSDSDDATVNSPDVQPAIAVEKLVDANGDGTFADSETAANPGDSVTYQVTVRNAGDDTVSLDSYDDSIYGVPTLNNSWPTELAPGESAVRTFTGSAPSDDASSKTNVFRVNASDDDGNDISDSDDATVNSPDIQPALTVVKTNDANYNGTFTDTEQAPAPGVNVTFKVNFTNDATESATIADISDDLHDVNTTAAGYSGCEALFGTTLMPGETETCYFNGTITSNDDASQTDTATVNLTDDDGNMATGSDTSTVTTPEVKVGICPRTPGFWSTHNEEPTGNNPDLVSDDLPIWLGDEGGSESIRVANASDTPPGVTSQEVFDYQVSDASRPSNGISKLYVHLLAAKLNDKNGAYIPDNVSQTMDEADAFLADHSESDWSSLSEEQQKQVLEWKDTLDAFNNGQYTGEDCEKDWWKDDSESDADSETDGSNQSGTQSTSGSSGGDNPEEGGSPGENPREERSED